MFGFFNFFQSFQPLVLQLLGESVSLSKEKRTENNAYSVGHAERGLDVCGLKLAGWNFTGYQQFG